MIAGLGEWFPPTSILCSARGEVQQDDMSSALLNVDAELSQDVALVRELVTNENATRERTTWTRRRATDETVVFAGIQAGRAALEDANIGSNAIDYVISSGALPDLAATHSTRIAAGLGIRGVPCLDIDVACAGPVVQLQLALALIASGQANKVLATQGNLFTRVMPEQDRARHYLGDAGTAFIVPRSSQQVSFAIESDGAFAEAVVLDRIDGSSVPWYLPGERIVIGSRDPAAAAKLVANTLRYAARSIESACVKVGLLTRELDVVAVMHPRAWVPRGIARLLGVGAERAPCTFEQYAHIGGCGPIVNLIEARRRGILRPGARVALYAQGAGFTRAAAVLRWE
jgi:3-oxoacyl-[acyl-carrier-protein] synthase III